MPGYEIELEEGWTSDLIYAFRILSNYASQNLSKRLEVKGITLAEFNVLGTLDAGPVAPSELANTLGTTRGAVTKIVNRLIKKSLVKRRANKEDRYHHLLTLTPAASVLMPELQQILDESVTEVFKWLIAEDRAHLERIMLKLLRFYRKDHGLD